MSARPVTDAQISRALRAHLPERAAAGLRERVLDATRTTSQQRALPLFLGALSEADPVTRRRNLLIAAALLVALAFASAAAVGALRLLQRDPIHELNMEPPADLPAFVLSSHERLPQLPPLALTWHDSDSAKGRIYVDRSGAVRFDRFTSADATEPSSYRILSPNHRISGMAPVGSEAVWVEQGHEAIGDDPRVFIGGILTPPGGGPGCETERDPSEVGSGTAAAGWRYVGLEYVAGRPTHHVACVGDFSLDIDLWLDIETRLILRSREPLFDEAGQPIPGQFSTTEVTEIAFGEQPAAVFEPPESVTRMSEDAYNAYICARDLPNEMAPGISDCPTTGEAEATPLPERSATPDTRRGPSDCAVPSSDPSEPTGSLAWTQASLKEDWPAPVRPEPAGGGSVQPMPLTHLDPTGDTGSDVLPCVDIRAVIGDTREVVLKLVSNQPPVVDPAEQWIAYGVVTDDDRDGVPDWRYGIDNTPPEATMDGGPGTTRTRWWRTNLHTGRTDTGPMDGPGSGDWLGAIFKSEYPSGSDAGFRFRGALQIGGKGSVPWGIELDMPFYAWSSVIVNGRVVATDYAPDAGWLVATRGARPGGTFLLEGTVFGTGSDFQLPLSMTLPGGWHLGSEGIGGAVWVYRTGAEVTRDKRSGVLFAILDDTSDGCGEPPGTPYGPSVDDLVTYLVDQPKTDVSIDISENKDVILDGYRGAYLEYEMASRDHAGCGVGDVTTAWPTWNDQHSQVWILDVDGVRLVIEAYSPPASSETVRAELREAVESIDFER